VSFFMFRNLHYVFSCSPEGPGKTGVFFHPAPESASVLRQWKNGNEIRYSLAVTASRFGAWAPLAFCDRCA
jgi:hypothetical protein